MAGPLLEARGLSLAVGSGSRSVVAVDGVSLSVAYGETISIVGGSGSGKTSLLRMLGGLRRPTGGSLTMFGESTAGWSYDRWAQLRRSRIGIVYQEGNLFSQLTAQENVEAQLRVSGLSGSTSRRRAASALKAVGLADRASHFPSELSGGQAQRVAVARAAVMNPELLLADEPTASLDATTADEVMALLVAAAPTLVMVTHQPRLAASLGRSVEMRDGQMTPLEMPLQ